MSWDYAELSHMAKEAGGPDLLLSTLESAARGQGRIEGAGVGALVTSAAFVGGAWIYHQYAKRKKLAADAKAALVTGINEYDAAYATVTTADSIVSDVDESTSETDQDLDDKHAESEE